MQDDEIIINRWLADQLDVRPGESVRLTYYEFSTWNTFTETNRIFKVSRIIEMDDLTRERELSPPYPSLKDAETCAEWDIGMPLDKTKLTDAANEAYWNQYRTTPKAIITLNAGQQMWSNRFGRLTAARFPAHQKPDLESTILAHLTPSDLGLSFKPVRDIALKAATESMNFGQLFLGLSFFLIIASTLLTRMLFGFSLQQRARETGILLAQGFSPGQIRRLWFQECVLLAAVGAAAGTALGSGYTRALIWGLGHAWQSAVASTDIQYAATAHTLATGFIASFLIAITSLLLAIRAQSRKSAQTLLTLSPSFQTVSTNSPRRRMRIWLPLSELSAALALIGYAALVELQDYTGLFFAAGSILLISLLGIIRLILRRLSQTGNSLSLTALSLRNAGRQESRSMTAASLLACGSFLILAVSAMQLDIDRSAHRRDSGTGGFTLFGESTLPIQADLNRPEGQQKYGLTQSPDLLTGNIVSMKIRAGDDASCLNLNRAQTPTLIGVDPSEFTKRGAFQSTPKATDLWELLEAPLPDGTIPGLAGDANTAQWGLKTKTGKDSGDVLTFTDEQGRPFRVKLTGTLPAKLSVFQGTVLISTRHFTKHYPSENGVRMFLIDAPPDTARQVRELLTRKLEKWGLNIISTTDRRKRHIYPCFSCWAGWEFS
jgi:putative ABC transport system permease protein